MRALKLAINWAVVLTSPGWIFFAFLIAMMHQKEYQEALWYGNDWLV